MNHDFKIVLNWLTDEFVKNKKQEALHFEDMPSRLNSAFLIALTEIDSKIPGMCHDFLLKTKESPEWGSIADFYLKGIKGIQEEIAGNIDNEFFSNRLKSLSRWLTDENHDLDDHETVEKIWSVFFPEGCNILSGKTEAVEALRDRRRIKITGHNMSPIINPAEEILFTSNVLLTVPPYCTDIKKMPVNKTIQDKLAQVIDEDQLYWYDHPVEVGVKHENNEFLYGLTGFKEALHFEKKRGNISSEKKPVFLMSVSVTHDGLHEIAKPYLEDLLNGTDLTNDIDIYLFTEKDTQDIINDIFIPAASRFLNRDASSLKVSFGVNGEYGRHYSFLKAIALFWNVLIDDKIKATFKIDLDQVFPQDKLVDETGKSAFEHFKTDLWGANGVDSSGNPVELGMIAGTLVNFADTSKGLFTPDVLYPEGKPKSDEIIFFSQLPQALSTEGEMMTRYGKESGINGIDECIERIHVTGGTNGILVESLKSHRPFTPSFIGRAEDQAYIISTLFNRMERLAYLHEEGLIMRHDKDSFAKEAIKSSNISKLIGDYIRILYFSAYGRAISGDLKRIKRLMDPYTGCFISYIPITLVFMRFALKVVSLLKEGKTSDAHEFICSGAKRISEALDFCDSKKDGLKEQYEKERKTWKLFYDTMSAIEDSIKINESYGYELREKTRNIVKRCLLKK